MKIKVGVLFGGVSVEHEVSIISALQAIKNMDTNKYQIIPIYIDKKGVWHTGEVLKDINTYKDMSELERFTSECILVNKGNKFYLQTTGFFKRYKYEIDIIFPIVHGTNVEDGKLQGYLETINIPYVGSDVLASAVGQDKVIQKSVYEVNKLPVLPFIWFYDYEYNNDNDKYLDEIKKLGYPVIIKPANLGSSIGISVANNLEEVKLAIKEAISYDKKILVEKCLTDLKEVNISVLGNYQSLEVSQIEEVNNSHHILTFDDKYLSGSKTKSLKGLSASSRKIPTDIPKKMQEEIIAIAKKAFLALGNSGVVRIDFLVDNTSKKVYINEINTCPGSLAFYLWEPSNKKYSDLLDELIKIGIRNYQTKQKKINSFDSNILSNFNGTKGVKGTKF